MSDPLPTEAPTPPQAPSLDALARRVVRLEERMAQLGPVDVTLNEHDDRLDELDRQVVSITESMSDLRITMHGLSASVGKLSDSITVKNLGVDRLEQQLKRDRETQVERDKSIQSKLDELVHLLQPRAVL